MCFSFSFSYLSFFVENPRCCLVNNIGGFHIMRKIYFSHNAEGKKDGKTSNALPKCIWILERGALRCKSKRLAQASFPTTVTSLPRHLLPLGEGLETDCHAAKAARNDSRFDGCRLYCPSKKPPVLSGQQHRGISLLYAI